MRGASSFEDAQTVNGEACPSFRDPCQRLDHLANNDEWKSALRTAFSSSFIPLSEVNATILGYCNPSSPSELWTEHKTMFITEILHRWRQHRHALQSDNDAASYALSEVQNHLKTMNRKSLKGLGLQLPDDGLPLLQEESSESNLQEMKSKVDAAYSSCNGGQRAVFN